MKYISHCKSRVGYEAIRRRNELSFIITSSEFHHAPFDVYSETSSLGIEKVRSDTNNADSTECYRDRKFNHQDSTTRSLVFKLRTLPRTRQGVWYHWHRCINARRARTHARIARARAHTRAFGGAWRACARARRAYLQYMQINMPCEGTGCKERTRRVRRGGGGARIYQRGATIGPQ